MVAAAIPHLSGCYYGHLAVGQTRLLWASRPIDAVLEDPETSQELRSKLQLVLAARHYADELGLEVDDQYTSYLAWPGDRIVTTVVASRPGELEPAGFWFPFLGTLPYKGFFSPERAEREANALREDGLDVCVSAIRAYSTLGWFDDPITQPMLASSDGGLVETIVHELVHATVYAKGEPEFNESIATFIGQEAAIAYFDRGEDARESSDETTRSRPQRTRVHNARLVSELLGQFRRDVALLYRDAEEHEDLAPRRAAMETQIRDQLSALSLDANDPEAGARLAKRVRLNDACLALGGTYTDDLERHSRVFRSLAGDLPAFVARLREMNETDDVRERFFQSQE